MTDRPELERAANELSNCWEGRITKTTGAADMLMGIGTKICVTTNHKAVRDILTPDTILRLARECLTDDERRWFLSFYHEQLNDNELCPAPNLRILAGEEADDD